MGPALAEPVIAPRDDARRLEVLFLGAPTANGPNHDPITRYRVLKKGLGVDGINLTYSEDPSTAFTDEVLGQYDAVLLYGNWNQRTAMPSAQLKALLDYVEGGGGFVPVHCASACYGGSPKFIKLVGAQFKSHGGGEFQVKNVLSDHPILKGLNGYKAWDESYVHSKQGDDREILQMRDEEPWTWTRTEGDGRVFYTAGGHDHRVWDLPDFQHLLRNGIRWAVGTETLQLLENLKLPTLEQEKVSLPGYLKRKEITMAQKPISSSESIKLAQVPAGMELSLFASEPDIVNPIHVNWDERGRAFVIETIDYPNNLQAENLGHDRITICEDTDGDGSADKFTRFAEKLSIPTSLVFANGGVICTNASEMLFLKDTDGDDKADVRKVLFEGFKTNDTHAGVSNLRYGFDGWIYATIGYAGFDGTVGGEKHQFATGLFRFLPDGTKLEFLQMTTNNTWGLGFTEEFDLIGSTANGNPSWFATFTLAAYQGVQLSQPRTPRADDNPLFFPMSTDIRQVDQFDKYTAAAGHAVYTARRFPETYQNRIAFICGPTGKLVANFEMSRVGAGWKATQSPNNLYSSADAWSAPVCAEVGPDGAVWLCDWYNIIIQHNPTPSIPAAGLKAKTGKGNAYETPLRDKQHGRIYRIYPKKSVASTNPEIAFSEPTALLTALNHSNLFWRLHAQRMITEGKMADLNDGLIKLVKNSEFAAPHALHALAKLGQLKPALVIASLKSEREATRRAAISLASPDQLKASFIKSGDITAVGRDLAEILIGFSNAAADPEIGAAIHALLSSNLSISGDASLNDAWQIAARRQAAGVLTAAGSDSVDHPRPEAKKNLLPNRDFSEVIEGIPSGWSDLRFYSDNPGGVRIAASKGGRNGGNSLMVSSKNRVDCGVAVTVKLEPGKHYQLSGWIKTDKLKCRPKDPGALMNVHGIGQSKGVKETRGWTKVSMDFLAPPDGEVLIHCLFGGYGGASGTAWWDDVSLVELTAASEVEKAMRSLRDYHSAPKAPAKEIVRNSRPDPEIHVRGEEIYARTCIACHGVDGKGVPDAFPPIDGSDWLTGDPELPIKIVLHGLMGPVKVGEKEFNSVMAPLGPTLSDQEIADVLTYVRQRWSNDASPVDSAQVKKVRAATVNQKAPWTAKGLGR